MKTDAELIAALIEMSNELANRGISAMKVLSAHINSIRARDPVNGRIVSALKKPAPVGFSSGAPVAQTECATGEFVLTGKPSGARRATAALPVAQQQQAGVSCEQDKCRKISQEVKAQ